MGVLEYDSNAGYGEDEEEAPPPYVSDYDALAAFENALAGTGYQPPLGAPEGPAIFEPPPPGYPEQYYGPPQTGFSSPHYYHAPGDFSPAPAFPEPSFDQGWLDQLASAISGNFESPEISGPPVALPPYRPIVEQGAERPLDNFLTEQILRPPLAPPLTEPYFSNAAAQAQPRGPLGEAISRIARAPSLPLPNVGPIPLGPIAGVLRGLAGAADMEFNPARPVNPAPYGDMMEVERQRQNARQRSWLDRERELTTADALQANRREDTFIDPVTGQPTSLSGVIPSLSSTAGPLPPPGLRGPGSSTRTTTEALRSDFGRAIATALPMPPAQVAAPLAAAAGGLGVANLAQAGARAWNDMKPPAGTPPPNYPELLSDTARIATGTPAGQPLPVGPALAAALPYLPAPLQSTLAAGAVGLGIGAGAAAGEIPSWLDPNQSVASWPVRAFGPAVMPLSQAGGRVLVNLAANATGTTGVPPYPDPFRGVLADTQATGINAWNPVLDAALGRPRSPYYPMTPQGRNAGAVPTVPAVNGGAAMTGVSGSAPVVPEQTIPPNLVGPPSTRAGGQRNTFGQPGAMPTTDPFTAIMNGIRYLAGERPPAIPEGGARPPAGGAGTSPGSTAIQGAEGEPPASPPAGSGEEKIISTAPPVPPTVNGPVRDYPPQVGAGPLPTVPAVNGGAGQFGLGAGGITPSYVPPPAAGTTELGAGVGAQIAQALQQQGAPVQGTGYRDVARAAQQNAMAGGQVGAGWQKLTPEQAAYVAATGNYDAFKPKPVGETGAAPAVSGNADTDMATAQDVLNQIEKGRPDLAQTVAGLRGQLANGERTPAQVITAFGQFVPGKPAGAAATPAATTATGTTATGTTATGTTAAGTTKPPAAGAAATPAPIDLSGVGNALGAAGGFIGDRFSDLGTFSQGALRSLFGGPTPTQPGQRRSTDQEPRAIWPVHRPNRTDEEGEITTDIHEMIPGRTKDHQGWDIPGDIGDNVSSIFDGKVVAAGFDPSYGNYVTIVHPPTGATVRYGHFDKPASVKQGDTVKMDQVVGQVGQTGFATGPHTHLEVRNTKGELIDPRQFFPDATIRKV